MANNVTPTSLLNRIKGQPQQVVSKLVDYIPEKVLLNPNVKIADTSMGGGHYLKEVIDRRLNAGMSREDAVRNLYGFESNTVYLNHARWKLDLQDVNLAILKSQDLNKLGMKFGAIITNPPYQDSSTNSKSQKLWIDFAMGATELLEDGGYMAFVTPASVIGTTRVPAQFRKKFTTDLCLDFLDHDDGEYFPGVGVKICSWGVHKVKYTGKTEVTSGGVTKVLDIRKTLPTPFHQKVIQDLADKIYDGFKKSGIPYVDLQTIKLSPEPVDNGKHIVYISGRNKFIRTDQELETFGQWKFVASGSATYKQWFVTQDVATGTNFFVPVNGPEEGVALGDTLMHPVMRFYLDAWKKTAGYTPALKNKGCLPDIRGIADEDVYEVFGLDEADRKLIADTVQEYKSIERVL